MHFHTFYPNESLNVATDSTVSFRLFRSPNFKLRLRSPLASSRGTSAFAGKFIRSQRGELKWNMSRFICRSSRRYFQNTKVIWSEVKSSILYAYTRVTCWMFQSCYTKIVIVTFLFCKVRLCCIWSSFHEWEWQVSLLALLSDHGVYWAIKSISLCFIESAPSAASVWAAISDITFVLLDLPRFKVG